MFTWIEKIDLKLLLKANLATCTKHAFAVLTVYESY